MAQNTQAGVARQVQTQRSGSDNVNVKDKRLRNLLGESYSTALFASPLQIPELQTQSSASPISVLTHFAIFSIRTDPRK